MERLENIGYGYWLASVAKRAWQLTLLLVVPGGLIVLALMWWFERQQARGNT